MPISNYPNGFPNGVNIRGLPLLNTYAGQVLWVNSNTGSNSNKGTRARPFSTIDYAVGRCASNAGDIIMVMPGHTEALTGAAQVNLDVAGITVQGLGNGSDLPELQYDNAAATLAVSADSVTVRGINFNASVTGVTVGVNVPANVNYTTIEDCIFDVDTTGTDEFEHAIRLVDGNIGALIQRNVIHMGLGGAIAAIHMDADTSYTRLLNNYITGDYSTACIAGDTTLSTNILIKGNMLIQGIGGDINTEPGIELLTGTTGVIADNYIAANLANAAASIVADTCFRFENYYSEVVSTGTGIIIGTPG